MTPPNQAAATPDRVFRRTASIDPQKGVGAVARITAMCFRYPWRVGLAFAATVPAVLMQLAIPVILGRAIDESLAMTEQNQDVGTLIIFSIALLVASVLRGLFTLVQNYSAESVGHALAQDFRNAIYYKVQRLPFSFHDRTHSGDLIT